MLYHKGRERRRTIGRNVFGAQPGVVPQCGCEVTHWIIRWMSGWGGEIMLEIPQKDYFSSHPPNALGERSNFQCRNRHSLFGEFRCISVFHGDNCEPGKFAPPLTITIPFWAWVDCVVACSRSSSSAAVVMLGFRESIGAAGDEVAASVRPSFIRPPSGTAKAPVPQSSRGASLSSNSGLMEIADQWMEIPRNLDLKRLKHQWRRWQIQNFPTS